LLRYDNTQLKHEKDAERALKDLNELSQYESKTEIPLDNVIKLNKLCNHMSSFAQNHCRKEVTCEFLTEFDDDFEMTTNSDALERLLTHLLNYSVRYTHQGVIKLKCEEAGANVRFSVTDTSLGLGNKPKNHVVGMFAEEEDTVRYVGMNFNICQSITRLLHGRIWHDVDYTNGTRFIFEIPKSPNT
jgi:signal transduction histidine kinase